MWKNWKLLTESSFSLNVALSPNMTMTDNNKTLESEIAKLKEQNEALKVEVVFNLLDILMNAFVFDPFCVATNAFNG